MDEGDPSAKPKPMKHIPPPQSFPRARALLKSATPTEQQLWKDLREHWPAMRFRRQMPIAHYIADFASHRLKLVIELDGGQHNEEVDAHRSTVIEAQGYTDVDHSVSSRFAFLNSEKA